MDGHPPDVCGGRPSDVCRMSDGRPLDFHRTSVGRSSDVRRTPLCLSAISPVPQDLGGLQVMFLREVLLLNLEDFQSIQWLGTKPGRSSVPQDSGGLLPLCAKLTHKNTGIHTVVYRHVRTFTDVYGQCFGPFSIVQT